MGCGSSTEEAPAPTTTTNTENRLTPFPNRDDIYNGGGSGNVGHRTVGGDGRPRVVPHPHPENEPDTRPAPKPRPSGGYKKTPTGLYELFHDFRKRAKRTDANSRPNASRSNLYVDKDFPLQKAITNSGNDMEWKRPGEICDDPKLFTDGTTRFDIGQGAAGTCWFLSMVANISEKPKQFKRIVPDDAYYIGSNKYDGVFHCKFWRFGQWVDMYIDDFLPVLSGKYLWGAKSSTDENEFWVALLEKAFARFHGSYNSTDGGVPGDSYLSLSGGVSESVKLVDIKSEALFRRVKNALTSGALVTCVVPEENDNKHKLVGGHAYSLTGSAAVPYRGKQQLLFRARNPWGKREWNGPWCDGSPEIKSLAPGTLDVVDKDDGEFWIAIEDFFKYFSQATICSLTPDFNLDGRGDSLNYVMYVYGEWKGETAAGWRNRVANPRFIFTVHEEGRGSMLLSSEDEDEGKVPFVMQIIQKIENRQQEKVALRCDLYRVIGEDASGRQTLILEELGEDREMYRPETQVSFRHSVVPGRYIAVPSTSEVGEEKEFLIRLFSGIPLSDCKEIKPSAAVMTCNFEEPLLVAGKEVHLNIRETYFCAWKAGYNSGGQISKDSHHLNPQYAFSVPDEDYQPLEFHVMQEPGDIIPLGIRIYPAPERMPATIKYIYDIYKKCPANIDGDQSKYVAHDSMSSTYSLPPGDYFALLFTDEPDINKRFTLVIRSTVMLNVIGYRTGEDKPSPRNAPRMA